MELADSTYQRSRINVHLPPNLRQQLDELATQTGLSVTKLIESLLTESLGLHLHHDD